jgi:hypothetical protein
VRASNGRLRDEFLIGKIFCSLKEAQILDGEVACGIQHGASPLRNGLEATGTTSNLAFTVLGLPQDGFMSVQLRFAMLLFNRLALRSIRSRLRSRSGGHFV